MRFTVGKQYPFFFMQYVMHGVTDPASTRKCLNGMGPQFLPWRDKAIKGHVEMLTCIEHHRVPDAHDPEGERTCDGFIFKDNEGNLWYNQYPHASYGQLDDSGDRFVRRHFESLEGVDIENTPLRMELAFYRLSEIHRGIYQMQQRAIVDGVDNTKEVAALTGFAESLDTMLTMLGGKVVVEQTTYGPDHQWLKGFYSARFESEPSDAHIGD